MKRLAFVAFVVGVVGMAGFARPANKADDPTGNWKWETRQGRQRDEQASRSSNTRTAN